jgi:FeS assembly SUF system regulator
MLRMSKLADYGTVVMTYVAQKPGRMPNAGEIALAVGLEQPTVSKLLKLLTNAGLLVSRRGAAGGYGLSRPPQKISVADIIDAIEGTPMGLTECSSMPGLCTRELSCSVRGNWQRISQSIRDILEKVSLAELAMPVPQAIGFSGKPVARQPDMLDEPLETLDEHHNQTTG